MRLATPKNINPIPDIEIIQAKSIYLSLENKEEMSSPKKYVNKHKVIPIKK
jgi:hypothetical protein